QRHGPTGTVNVQFDAAVTRFDNLARDDQMPQPVAPGDPAHSTSRNSGAPAHRPDDSRRSWCAATASPAAGGRPSESMTPMAARRHSTGGRRPAITSLTSASHTP